jgi:hypothetical protein
MDVNQLVFPMFVMVLLTFSTLARLFFARRKSVAEGKVNAEYFKVYQGSAEPEASAKLARHFTNLFEAPVLFYAACLAGMALHIAGTLFLTLAWAYVLLRVIHTSIHTGANKLYPRIAAYFSSWLVLLVMWVLLALSGAGWA